MSTPRQRIILYLVLTYGFSTFFYIRIATSGKMRMLPVLGLMYCPGAAALLVRAISGRNAPPSGLQWGPTRWPIVAYLLPAGLGLAVYGIVWASGIGGFRPEGLAIGQEVGLPMTLPATVLVLATVGMLQSAFFAFGEELGWRGLLVPELARITKFTGTALIAGAAWSVYHYPLILFANYRSAAPKWFALVVFTWMVTASSFAYAWLRLKSGSLWPAVVLHASHNLYVQQVFDPLTTDRGRTSYVTTEFGVGLAIGYTIAAWYFWRRRGEVEARTASAPA